MKKQLLYIVRNRLLQHLIFWLVAFVILLRIFTDQELWKQFSINAPMVAGEYSWDRVAEIEKEALKRLVVKV